MSMFSRWVKRLRAGHTTHPAAQSLKRRLCLEPLEARRLLLAAPNNFVVSNLAPNDPEVRLTWSPVDDATSYEIQSSVNGLDGAAGLWTSKSVDPQIDPLTGEQFAIQQSLLKRYRSLYFRIQTIPPEATPDWTAIKRTPSREGHVLQLSATVTTPPAPITLQWPEEFQETGSTTYTISRKGKDETTFLPQSGSVVKVVGAGGVKYNTWEDSGVTAGKAYEYKVERFLPTGIGFIYAGIDLPLGDDDSTIQSPGTVILVIDETQIDAMQPDDVIAEINRLKLDLLAEGWKVEVVDDVNPNDTPADVRKKIFDIYDADKTNVKAVFLIGHIPVPMSGSSSPDGHVPSRPMPADVFYGDMDSDAMGVSLWDLDGGNLDEDTVPADPVGGVDNDGKPVELMVGRVDMRDLPEFQLYDRDMDETELLRRYLDKDHAFRTGQVAIERGGQIRDQIGYPDSSTGAWQTMSGFFGPADPAVATPEEPDNIDVTDRSAPTWPFANGSPTAVTTGVPSSKIHFSPTTTRGISATTYPAA